MSGLKFRSLRVRLLISMLFAALIPILIIDLIMYSRYLEIIQKNTSELTRSNLSHIETSLDTWVDLYEEVMHQVYSDEDIKEMLDEYRTPEGGGLSKSGIRQKLNTYLYSKEHIMSITIVTEYGDSFFCDRVTPFSYHPFWLQEYSMTMGEIYDLILSTDNSVYLATEYAKTSPNNNRQYYLFHMAHQMTYGAGAQQKKAVVIVSIDEQLLEEICNPQGYRNKNSVTFMVDSQGKVISYEDSSYLTRDTGTAEVGENKKNEKYLEFVRSTNAFDRDNLAVETQHDAKLNWDIVNVSVKNRYNTEITRIQQMVISMAVGSAVLVIIIVLFTTRYLMSHVYKITNEMHRIEEGDMDVRIESTSRMPTELATIADHLNNMLDQLELSMEKEKIYAEREKVAEIAALEARINPHFLYNTLDTINWMAIDRDEIEISNAISALGKILRYGISNSNGIVSIATEIEWLKEYIHLQQTRLKDTFRFELDVEPQAMQCNIHKLLFQPFVENSIIHGFTNKKDIYVLKISITLNDSINIKIEDNGAGMKKEQVEAINSGQFQHYDEKYHVGMENAFQRINMYYGDAAGVRVESEPGRGTIVYITLPKDEGMK